MPVLALVALLVALPLGLAGAQGSDDNIPNAAALAWGTDQSGDLNHQSDTDDVYRLDLKKGSLVTLALTGSAKTDFDLYLFGPGAVNIQDDNEIAASETSGSSNESIRYTASQAGTYYLDVATWDSDGTYTLKARIRPTLSISRSKSIFDYGNSKAAVLSGIMDPPRAGVTVKIKSAQAGSTTFSSIGSAQIGADGKYRFELKEPVATAKYRADWAGDVAFLPTNSGETEVSVRPVFIGWETVDKEIASTNSTTSAIAKTAGLSGRLKAQSYLPDGQKIAIELVDSEGDTIQQTLGTVVTTQGKGWFSYDFSHATPGIYYVRAHYLGEARWLPEASQARKITVLP